jgi:hypothetical protein
MRLIGDPAMAVSEAPQTSTRGRHEHEKATLVEELVGFLGGLGGPNLSTDSGDGAPFATIN